VAPLPQDTAGSGGAGTYVVDRDGALPTGLSLSSAESSAAADGSGRVPVHRNDDRRKWSEHDELVLNHHGGTGNDHDHAQAQVPRDRGSRIRGTG